MYIPNQSLSGVNDLQERIFLFTVRVLTITFSLRPRSKKELLCDEHCFRLQDVVVTIKLVCVCGVHVHLPFPEFI